MYVHVIKPFKTSKISKCNIMIYGKVYQVSEMWKRKTECDTSRDRPPRGALNLENKGKASRKYLNKSFC